MRSRYLCTFSGKFGDILWSLPTVRLISQTKGEPVDFACMPQYNKNKFLGLLSHQSYICDAYSLSDWHLLHSNHGDQPWQPPKQVEKDYEQVWHLTYRNHPGLGGPSLQLMDFTAWQQGLRLSDDPLPFLTAPEFVAPTSDAAWKYAEQRYAWCASAKPVAYAWNEQYADKKVIFMTELRKHLGSDECYLVDVSQMNWIEAAVVINDSLAYVGCRSALWVVANGFKKRIICFEPHASRNQSGHLGKIFGCTYNPGIINLPMEQNMSIPQQAAHAASTLREWIKTTNGKRRSNETNSAKSGGVHGSAVHP